MPTAKMRGRLLNMALPAPQQNACRGYDRDRQHQAAAKALKPGKSCPPRPVGEGRCHWCPVSEKECRQPDCQVMTSVLRMRREGRGVNRQTGFTNGFTNTKTIKE